MNYNNIPADRAVQGTSAGPAPAAHVSMAYERLRRATDALHGVIGDVIARFDSVCVPISEQKDEQGATPSTGVGMADALHDQCMYIEGATRRLEDLFKRASL